MDSGTSAKLEAAPRTPRHEIMAVVAWPVAVQISVVLAVTATLFFLLGRWSHGGSSPPEALERAGPALDLNRATKAELRLVPGLGDSLSQRVVEYRERAGGFRSIDDLRNVHGVGPKTLERIRPHFFIGEMPLARTDSGMMPSQMATSPPPRVAPKSKKEAELTSAINVNVADQAELQKLPGIGPKMSQRILEQRAKAPFKSIDELRRVSGIGPKTLEKLRPYVTID